MSCFFCFFEREGRVGSRWSRLGVEGKKKPRLKKNVLILQLFQTLFSTVSFLASIPCGAQWSLEYTQGGRDLGTPLGQSSAAARPSAADASSPATANFRIASVTPESTPGGRGGGGGEEGGGAGGTWCRRGGRDEKPRRFRGAFRRAASNIALSLARRFRGVVFRQSFFP